MPWARSGDTAGSYPRLLAVEALPDAPAGAVPMMFGFLSLLATTSAAFLTDYLVTEGEVRRAGGGQHDWLLAAALKTGLLTKHRGKIHGVAAYRLIDDPDFIHIRLKEEVEWERQQRRDTLDLRIAVPVRTRDGDLCRYCGVIVHWMGKKSPRKATLDHRVPIDSDGTRPPATVATMVVACLSCNSEMRDAAGEQRPPLRPEPDAPFYSKSTAEWLTKNGRPTAPTVPTSLDSDPATTGPRATLPARQRPAHAAPEQAPDSDPAPAGPRADQGRPHDDGTDPPPTPPEASTEADSLSRVSLNGQVEDRESSGTGRDGTGHPPLYGSGHPPAQPPGPPRTGRRRRSSRGRRPNPPGATP